MVSRKTGGRVVHYLAGGKSEIGELYLKAKRASVYRPDRPSDPMVVWYDECVEMTDDRMRAVDEMLEARKK